MNERLNKHNADLARNVKEYKRKGLILSTWIKTCDVIIKTKEHTLEQCEIITIHDDCDITQCGDKNLSKLCLYI